MACVYRQYENSNSSVLENSITRGDSLYGLKLLNSSPNFTNEQGSILRMRISLACIEAKAIVIDAYIQTDNNLTYLFILCSSPLEEKKFAKVIKNNLPKVIIEKFLSPQAKEYIQNASEKKLLEKNSLLFSSIEKTDKTREFLLSILIEYKALLLDNSRGGLLNSCINKKREEFFVEFSNINKNAIENLNMELIFFEKNKKILCVPVFQIHKIDKDVFQKKYIEIFPVYGGKKIFIDDVFFIKTINISDTRFCKKIEKGIYQISVTSKNKELSFNLLIPPLTA